MPLRVVRRQDTGTLQIVGTIRPAGSPEGIRIRKRASTDSLALAREEAAAIETRALRDAWHGRRIGTVTFHTAVDSYMTHEPRSKDTQRLVARLIEQFGDVPLSHIDQDAATDARKAMFAADVSPGTVRRALFTPLTAILSHAAHPSRKWCEPPQFDVPAEPKGRTEFMLPAQVEALLSAADPRTRPLLAFLVCTGCRMSEALGLQWGDVDLGDGRAILHEGETKSGHRRIVLLPPAAVAALQALAGRSGPVFLTHRGLPYRDSSDGGGQVKRAWATASRGAGLPGDWHEWTNGRGKRCRMWRSQFTPHHLRHTWASWHYRLHRDLLKLKLEGGWADLAMVERYAHLMPSGHDTAIRRVWGL